MKPYVKGLLNLIESTQNKLTDYQDKCKHPNVTKTHGANTGNYDPTSDYYWTDFKCLDCNRWWRQDGSH
jgi:hypothetical protein